MGQDGRVEASARPRAPGTALPITRRVSPVHHRAGIAHRSPRVRGGRLVSFLVSFMFVYLRPSPSMTRSGAGSRYQHGQSWTGIPHSEKREMGHFVARCPGMKLGRGWGLRWVCGGSGGWRRVEGACWGWRAVRRHRFALDRSRPLKSLVLGSPLRVMPAAAASACISLLIDVRDPVGRPAFRSRLVLRAASGGGT